MRFFTRGWHAGELSDEESDRVRDAYWEHVRTITPRLPEAVAQLANQVSLHDAIFERVCVNRQAKTLTLILIGGEVQRGYWEVELSYKDVEIGDHSLQLLHDRARDRETEILYDELDTEEDDSFVHRLLFWPEGEISIWFKDLEIKKTPRPDRRVQLGGCFLEET